MKKLQPIKWCLLRVGFFACLAIGVTGVGILPVAPFLSKGFFNDWAFWRHRRHAWPLWKQALTIIFRTVFGGGHQWSGRIRWFSPPQSSPGKQAKISSTWAHGSSCATCSRCCEKVGCPLLTPEGWCESYDSFFWSYFLCGSFPLDQREVLFFECPKWVFPEQKASSREMPGVAPGLNPGLAAQDTRQETMVARESVS